MTSAAWCRFRLIFIVSICLVAGLAAADGGWKWSGTYGEKAVTLLIIGDVDIQRRADPTTAFVHLRDTLNRADLVYANLEGVLVKSQGPEVDIPDKKGWRHPGPEGALALKSANVKVVGVANNVAYGRDNILQTLKVLDAHGIAHTGGGANIDAAHEPAIIERKGVKIGFLQYTARWYRDAEQLATATTPGVAKITSRDGVTIDPSDVDRLRADIRRLRARADLVVVSHHNRDGGTPVQFGPPVAERSSGRRDGTKSEEYQRELAHVALETGADLVFGHGTHTVQGVEVYKGKPILYAIGHSAFDQPGYENSKDGLVVRVVVQGRNLRRVSFVPVTRDANNDVLMMDPSIGEGARLLQVIRGVSADVPLKIDGQEVVLLDRPTQISRR
ncbi:MAG: CapA family protein [Acidobacteria bacterium]|nr:CapA family protein [Acidobacteriota bacterium]